MPVLIGDDLWFEDEHSTAPRVFGQVTSTHHLGIAGRSAGPNTAQLPSILRIHCGRM
jgi:hypothetical protein